jgi:hypothetical protein
MNIDRFGLDGVAPFARRKLLIGSAVVVGTLAFGLGHVGAVDEGVSVGSPDATETASGDIFSTLGDDIRNTVTSATGDTNEEGADSGGDTGGTTTDTGGTDTTMGDVSGGDSTDLSSSPALAVADASGGDDNFAAGSAR